MMKIMVFLAYTFRRRDKTSKFAVLWVNRVALHGAFDSVDVIPWTPHKKASDASAYKCIHNWQLRYFTAMMIGTEPTKHIKGTKIGTSTANILQ